MKVALLCSGLGHVHRGHEVFARDLFDLLRDALDITLFKGGGEAAQCELVIDNIPRYSVTLDFVHVTASPKWADAVREQLRLKVETETFAYAALKPLLEGDFDIVHCLEQEVCNTIYAYRHLFRRTPKIVFSNGGAIPARDLPQCDFVQEHTSHNLSYSAKRKAFLIPHGVDLKRFRPDVHSDFRSRHGLPADAFVVLSVGTICHHHKRMDHVIREVAPLSTVYLVIVGQENQDTPDIVALGRQLMGQRVVFTTLPHAELPQAYAAANVFVLGSLFETFGIVFIEAMAMGLPVICTEHPNQRSIVQHGFFINMKQPGALTAVLRSTPAATMAEMGQRGRQFVEQQYDLRVLRQRYVDQYRAITEAPSSPPGYSIRDRLAGNLKHLRQVAWRLVRPGAE